MIGDKADALHEICPRNTAMLGGLIQLARYTRGERQPALWLTSSRSFRWTIVELRRQCGRFLEMRNRPRANPVGGLGEVTGARWRRRMPDYWPRRPLAC